MPSPRFSNRRPPAALITYLQNRDDAKIHQCLARQSILPGLEQYQDPEYHGHDPSSVGTSKWPDGTAITSDGSLPCLTHSAASSTVESVASSMGHREMQREIRVLAHDANTGGALVPEPFPPHMVILECPYDFLGCRQQFSGRHAEEWLVHSLTHLTPDGEDAGSAQLPDVGHCRMCDQTFHGSHEGDSWMYLMIHTKFDHHDLGHRLAHARPASHLIEHLWTKKLITRPQYRTLVPSLGNTQHPPTLSLSSSDEEDEEPGSYTLMNERRSREH